MDENIKEKDTELTDSTTDSSSTGSYIDNLKNLTSILDEDENNKD